MMFERFAAERRLACRRWASRCPTPTQFRAASGKLQRNRLLIFSRWCQVMFRFEKGLYGNPDQDLNRLWWDLVEKYQEIEAARRAQRARLRQQDPHRHARRSTITTT